MNRHEALLEIERPIKQYVRNDEEEKQLCKETAGRFSAGKVRYDLIPPWALNELAKIYTFGAEKYDDDNWWKGLKWRTQVVGCILRHVWKWCRGEALDPESNCHHLAHAAWNCFTLMTYERYNLGIDDRIPFELDLMDDKERERRINLWMKHKNQNTLKDYNGLNK